MFDIATILFNLTMVAIDLAALAAVRRGRSPAAWLASMAGCAVAAGVLAVFFSVGSRFDILRLVAWGLFFHGPVLLVGSAVVFGRGKRLLAAGFVAMAVALLAAAADAFLIEPTWFEVTRREIRSSKVDRPVRIVVLADLQTDQVGPYEREVMRRAMAEKPDLILLAGDYIQAYPSEQAEIYRKVNTLFRRADLPGPNRAFAIRGNVEAGDWTKIFRGTPIVPVESTESFELDGVRLTCLGVRDSFNETLRVAGDADCFHVVLGHSPDFAWGDIEADLLVAGHTHGGQVQLPLIGPLMKATVVPRSWASGWTDLPGGGQLLVSRGVGMERYGAPRLRFLCRPELAVIDVLPESAP